MEIADLNLISDFEAGIKHLKNNPSLISNLSSLTKLPQLHSFWTYGALILTIFATFTNLFNTTKTFIHQTLIKPFLSYRNSYPQHIFNNNVDSDFDFDFSSSDDDLDTPSSVADSDDEEEEHSDDNCRTDEVFLFRAEGEGDGGYWNNNNNNNNSEGQNGNFTSFNNLTLRRRNGRTDEMFRYWEDNEGQNGNFGNINNLTLRRRNGRVDEVFRVENAGGGYWNNNNEGQNGNFSSFYNLTLRTDEVFRAEGNGNGGYWSNNNNEGQNGNFTSFNNLAMRRRNGRVDEVFRAAGWNNNNNNNNDEGQNGNFNSLNNSSLRRRNGCSWSDFFAGKSVVKLWDLDAETVVLTAEVDGVNGGVGFGTYDSLVHEMSPAIYATWRPCQREIGFDGDGVACQKEE